MVYLFLGWVGAFPCGQATTVAEKLLENVSPFWGISNEISSDTGLILPGQIIKQLNKIIQT